MGQTEAKVKFEEGEALDGTGLPVLLSNTLDGFSSFEWWDMLENGWRNLPIDPAAGQIDYKVTDLPDGTFVCARYFGTKTGLGELAAGRVSTTFHIKIDIKREEDLCVTHCYLNDETMKDESCSEISYLKAHHDPFRLEFYMEDMPVRLHGPTIKSLLEDALGKVGIKVETFDNQPSPSDETKLSVLTGSLEGSDLTIETLFETLKKQAVESEYATEIPGGVLIEKEVVLFNIYSTITISEDLSSIMIKIFGSDEKLQDLRVVFTLRMVSDPKRLECWGENQHRREAGGKAKSIIEPLANMFVKMARGEDKA